MTSNAILSTTSNARTARGVSPFGILAAFDGFCRLVADTYDPPQILAPADLSAAPLPQEPRPRFAERRRCLAGWGAALARDRTSRGTRRRRDPYKRVARSRNSTRRAYRASTPLATKGQLQRPVLAPRRAAREQLHSYSAAPTAKQAKNKPWSSRSAPRRSRPWPRPAPPSRCGA